MSPAADLHVQTWYNDTGHTAGISVFTGLPNSHNHVMLCGGVSQWIWTQLAGLKPASPAFATISIKPSIDPVLGPSTVSAEFASSVAQSTFRGTERSGIKQLRWQ